MSSFLQQYAEVGAKIRLSEIESERKRILEMFPSLSDTNGNANQKVGLQFLTGTSSVGTVVSTSTPLPVPGKRPRIGFRGRKMTDAQRAQVSKRMRRYWAKKRAEKAQATS